jgi:hypothetical protein
MNRRKFLHSILATAAITTGLAKARLDLVEQTVDEWIAEVNRVMNEHIDLMAEMEIASRDLAAYGQAVIHVHGKKATALNPSWVAGIEVA